MCSATHPHSTSPLAWQNVLDKYETISLFSLACQIVSKEHLMGIASIPILTQLAETEQQQHTLSPLCEEHAIAFCSHAIFSSSKASAKVFIINGFIMDLPYTKTFLKMNVLSHLHGPCNSSMNGILIHHSSKIN